MMGFLLRASLFRVLGRSCGLLGVSLRAVVEEARLQTQSFGVASQSHFGSVDVSVDYSMNSSCEFVWVLEYIACDLRCSIVRQCLVRTVVCNSTRWRSVA